MESSFPLRARANFGALLQFPAGHRSAAGAKLAWLVKLRWAALLLGFLFAGPAVYAELLPRDSLPFFIGILACLGVFNLLTQLLMKDAARPVRSEFLPFQLACDLFAMTALLRLMGGLANPVAVLLYLHVVLGGLLLSRGPSWIFLLGVHGALAWLQAASFVVPLAQQSLAWLLLPHVMVLVFWQCVHYLGRHLDLQQRLLLSTSLAAEKQDRLRALGALAAGFSHEFASPLQTLRLRLDRLARAGGEGEDLAAARGALEDCTRVLHAMNQSQLDSRAGVAEAVDLSALADAVTKRWERENGVVVVRDVAAGVRARVPVLNFAQTLLNLLDNAAEAAAGMAPELALDASEGTVSLRVRDRGPGFPRAVLERIGEPFNTTKPAGTGLGLYVSELFAQSLGGSFHVRNRQPGAEAELRFPAGGL